jgi:hypothetical protein
MNDSRLPPFWIEWYDRWNLALPLALVGVVAWLVTLPRPVAPPTPPPQARPVVPPMQPTTMESPPNGSRWRTDQGFDVTGRAHPGAMVVLAYSTAPSLERAELSRMTTGADGVYRFRVSKFPAGQHVLQAVAQLPDGRVTLSPPADVWVTEPAKEPAASQRRRRAGPKK